MSADKTSAIHIKLESIIRSALAAADSSAEAGNLERATAALSLARDAQELYAASGPPEATLDSGWVSPGEPGERKVIAVEVEPVSTEWPNLLPGDIVRKTSTSIAWTVKSIGLDTGILGAIDSDGHCMRLRMDPHERWLLVDRQESTSPPSYTMHTAYLDQHGVRHEESVPLSTPPDHEGESSVGYPLAEFRIRREMLEAGDLSVHIDRITDGEWYSFVSVVVASDEHLVDHAPFFRELLTSALWTSFQAWRSKGGAS